MESPVNLRHDRINRQYLLRDKQMCPYSLSLAFLKPVTFELENEC